jgi:sialic acid synthase SpsE
MQNTPMLKHIAKKKKPMIISTGMANLSDIRNMVDLMREEDCDFMLTNCTSIYPTKYTLVNIGRMKFM